MNAVMAQQPLRRAILNRVTSGGARTSLCPKAGVHDRFLKTTRHQHARRDDSPIDFAYMPREDFFPEPQPEQFRVPLLPDNYEPPSNHKNETRRESQTESVARPTIATISADGTHIDSPSALSEVTDNHAQDVDVFDLTKKVSVAAASKAAHIGDALTMKSEEQDGAVATFVKSVLDDIFGPKKPPRA